MSEELSGMATGSRIQVQGELTFKKRGEMLYLNMDAKTIDMQPSMTDDEIVGEMTFRGKIGKEVECKQDKKGNPYIVFSAFSTEKKQRVTSLVNNIMLSHQVSRNFEQGVNAGLTQSENMQIK